MFPISLVATDAPREAAPAVKLPEKDSMVDTSLAVTLIRPRASTSELLLICASTVLSMSFSETDAFADRPVESAPLTVTALIEASDVASKSIVEPNDSTVESSITART